MTKEFVQQLAAEVLLCINKALEPVKAELAAAHQEIAALKATAYLKDAGLVRHGATYALGDVAQFSGSAWVCTKAHTRPAARPRIMPVGGCGSSAAKTGRTRDDARGIDPRSARPVRQVAAIERDVCALEQRGPVPDIEEVRRRLALVRNGVIEQLSALLSATPEVVH